MFGATYLSKPGFEIIDGDGTAPVLPAMEDRNLLSVNVFDLLPALPRLATTFRRFACHSVPAQMHRPTPAHLCTSTCAVVRLCFYVVVWVCSCALMCPHTCTPVRFAKYSRLIPSFLRTHTYVLVRLCCCAGVLACGCALVLLCACVPVTIATMSHPPRTNALQIGYRA